MGVQVWTFLEAEARTKLSGGVCDCGRIVVEGARAGQDSHEHTEIYVFTDCYIRSTTPPPPPLVFIL